VADWFRSSSNDLFCTGRELIGEGLKGSYDGWVLDSQDKWILSIQPGSSGSSISCIQVEARVGVANLKRRWIERYPSSSNNDF
jgi:hypothetical protein